MTRRELLAMAAATTFTPVTSWAQTGHRPTGFIRTNWSIDPFSLGAYSYVAKGARNSDRSKIGQSIDGRIFFAGEACNKKSGSGVHSAFQSAVATSEEIIALGIKEITIVGAGISGLVAAQRLSAHGLDVQVIEARDRVGGRICTDSTTLSAPVDLGASWIHNAQKNPATNLVHQFNIETTPTHEDRAIARDGTGRAMSMDDLPSWMDEVRYFQSGLGVDEANVNLFAYLFEGALSGDQLIFPQGYAQILQGLKGNYQLKLSTVLREVVLHESTVELKTSAGVERSEAVLITVPLGVLKAKTIRFDPALPTEKQAAIVRMGMGLLDKFYIQFDEVFWDKDAHVIATPDNGLPRGQFNVWLNLFPLFNAPILLAFNGGSPAHALANASDQEMLACAMQTLNRAYP